MIDTHCHIFKEYYENIDEVINNMGNNIMIVSGTSDKDTDEVIELCNKYPNVYGTIGIHPNEVEKVNEFYLLELEKKLLHPKIVAVGEIGLDYHYDVNKELQKSFFIKQLNIARQLNMPVVIHSRDSINEVYEILKDYTDLKISLHCFSSSMEMAKKFIELGFLLGFDGPITFKNNVKSWEIIKNIPLTSILIETDSPYLTPEPLRGRKNEPKNVIYIANKIAEIKEISLQEVLKITSSNAISQFDLPVKL